MALSHKNGTRVIVTAGAYRGKQGKVTIVGKLKTVVLDDGTELMGVDDKSVRVV